MFPFNLYINFLFPKTDKFNTDDNNGDDYYDDRNNNNNINVL